MKKKELEAHDRKVAERVVGLMIANDVTTDVTGDAIERMVERVIGAMHIARTVPAYSGT